MKRVKRTKLGYLYDPRAKPVVRMGPGEKVVVETEDAFNGRLRRSEDVTPEALRRFDQQTQYYNPLSGPIWIDGAQPGDVLAIHVDRIDCDDLGCVGVWPDFPERSIVSSWFAEPVVKLVPISEGHAQFGRHLTIPIAPMIGCMGTASRLESHLSKSLGPFGGNLDCPEVSPGNTLYLPVYVEGGLLFLGDVHALQGDGELCGVGLEVRAEVQLTIDLVKGGLPAMSWPRVETPEFLVSIVADATLGYAVQVGCREMILWLEAEYAFERAQAYALLSLVAEVRPGQAVGYPASVRCRFPRAWAEANRRGNDPG